MVTDKTRRSTFIEQNLGLVHACAGRFRGRGMEYDDLYSAGCVGLIKAYDNFDESRGVCFSTYAVPVILGEIKKLFREGGTVKVSRSLKELGMDPTIHDIRFVEDNWENPTLGAWGLAWEVWLNGMEVTQFTYFQQVGGLECKPVTGEITYGLERLAMYIQGVDSVYDLVWSDGPLGKTTYGDVFHQNEVEQSTYNFEYADVDFLFTCFEQYEKEAQQLLALENPLPLPAYERILKAAHSFNLLDARKAISVTERQRYILRIRTLTKAVAEAYYASREALGFPMCNKDK